MPRGQPTPIEKRIQAVAELESGLSAEQVAAKYGVSAASILNWKTQWDEHGFAGTEAAPADVAKPARSTEPDAPASDYESQTAFDDEVEEPPMVARKRRPAELITKSGRVLPPLPEQERGATRRVFPESFKFQVAAAIIAGDTTFTETSDHYDIADSAIRDWVHRARRGELRGSLPPINEEPARAAPAPVTHANGHSQNGHSELVAAPQAGLTESAVRLMFERSRTLELEVARKDAEIAARDGVIERLRADNERLQKRFKAALELASHE